MNILLNKDMINSDGFVQVFFLFVLLIFVTSYHP